MTIGVDARCLGIRDDRLKAGVYYVALHLLRELSKIDTKNKYILYSFNKIPKETMQQFSSEWENRVLSSKGWLYSSLPLEFIKQKPDVFLALSQAMPWYHPFTTIGFIHGLDFLPEFNAKRNKKLKKNSEYLIQHADQLITTSQFLKESLNKQYHKTNVVASWLGVDPVFFKNIKPYKMDTPYFLFVGTLKPSKNIPAILKAFSIFLKKTKRNYKFLFIGSDFWMDKNITNTINALNLSQHVTCIPSIESTLLPKYYKGAVAFVSPSLYEGFGLPFVEAMAAGSPIIGSDVGGIPEVVEDSGLLFNPTDVTSIYDAMSLINQNKYLRNKLITKGKKRAKKISWEKFSRDVFNTIHNI